MDRETLRDWVHRFNASVTTRSSAPPGETSIASLEMRDWTHLGQPL
jgi:hypothetical protein